MAESLQADAGNHAAPERVGRSREATADVSAGVLQRAAVQAFQGGRLDPRGLTPRTILALQRTLGNRAVNQLLRSYHPMTPAPVPLQLVPDGESLPPSPGSEISDGEIESAIAWAAKEKIGVEAIVEIQTALNISTTGVYDHDTVVAVFAKQREWQAKGKISSPGRAGRGFFERLGLIFTREIVDAAITDDLVKDIQENHPDGVTVALYSNYDDQSTNNQEFARQSGIFATNQKAVGVKGGEITIGMAVPITELGQVIETVQSIHRGLADKFMQIRQPDATIGPPEPPPWTRVKNLALFSHGEHFGVGLNSKNAFMHGGLHSTGTALNPPNVKALVRGLSSAIAPDIRVQLFACSTAHDTKRKDYDEWTGHKQGERAGENSFAASLAQEMGPDASVYGHTTAGHTTENFAARVFGKDAGGGQGGLHLFDLMYPEDFVSDQLETLFPDKTQDEWDALHDSLRDKMWAHFTDSTSGENRRRRKRYPVPIGQEMFVNPDHARELLQIDWATWITSRLKTVKPKKAPKPK